MRNMKKVECRPAWGFSVQSHDEDGIVDMVQRHARMHHGQQMPPGGLSGIITNG